MDASLQQLLEKLPGLNSDESTFPKCKVCEGHTTLFDCVDFNKHCSADPYRFGLSGIGVPYYRCGKCGFIFTDFIDKWSDDEIARYIYNDDYVKVDPQYHGTRALNAATEMARHLAGCERLKILDYGSGSGVFAEEMRRRGFQFIESYDPFSSPVKPVGLFDLITCFEVIEHSPQPLKTLTDMAARLSPDGAIIIGQTLQPGNIDEIGGRWWYLGPRNGHVSLFAEETFITLATQTNLTYHRGNGLYFFARHKMNKPIANVAARAGKPVHLWPLGAPGPEFPATGWQGIELAGRSMFRWSTSPEISWPSLDLRVGINLIQIPFLLSIRDGFVEQCIVTVDGKKLVTRVERGKISGEITVNKSRTCTVTLLTPPPLSPFDLRGVSDIRKLGLAVKIW